MPYIKEAIESVMAQDYKDWELIISDNGSKDETLNYLDTLVDSRIKIHKQETNLGVYGNLNFLLERAETPIAKIFCADDKLLPGALEKSYLFMTDNPDCAICRCWQMGDTETDGPTGYGGSFGDVPVKLNPAAAILMFATFGNVVGSLSTAICRPDLVLKSGGFNQRLPAAGDYECWLRVAQRYGVAFLKEELIYVRMHEQQNSKLLNDNNQVCAQQNEILEHIFSIIDESDKNMIRKHWTLHFIAPRTSYAFKFLLKGKFQMAFKSWRALPANISAIKAIASYPIWKSKSSIYYISSNKLRDRINELNL